MAIERAILRALYLVAVVIERTGERVHELPILFVGLRREAQILRLVYAAPTADVSATRAHDEDQPAGGASRPPVSTSRLDLSIGGPPSLE